MKNAIFLLVMGVSLFCCNAVVESKIGSNIVAEALEKLDNEQALVKIRIGDNLFYEPEDEVFDIRFGVNAIFMKGSLLNDQNGNIQFDFGTHDWYKKKPLSFTIVSGNEAEVSTDYGSLMIGKLSQTQTGIGEGYQLYNGKIHFQLFSKDAVVFTVSGNVISPGEAQIPENIKKIEGYIIVKKPIFDNEGLDLKEMYYE